MFNLKAAGNSEVVLTSERYTRKASLLDGIEAVLLNAPVDARYQRKVAQTGQPYFVLRSANNEVIGTSELYTSAAARDGGMEAVKKAALGATIDDELELGEGAAPPSSTVQQKQVATALTALQGNARTMRASLSGEMI